MQLLCLVQVDQRLKLQEEKALPPEDILDQAGAEGTVFGKWLIEEVGSADLALLHLTSQKWLRDSLVSHAMSRVTLFSGSRFIGTQLVASLSDMTLY